MISSDLHLTMASLVIINLLMLDTRPPQSHLLFLSTWKLATDKGPGEKVVCTILYLKKALDVIEHAILVSKMSKHGDDNELE